MDRIDAMRLFVRVVESGSFSAAARELGVGQPLVSKQIAALEARLGAQLLRRTSRSMTPTEAGQAFHDAALRLIDEMEAAESAVRGGQSAPRGLLRVTAAPVFARLVIVPMLPTFLADYPDVSVELQVSERTVNLVEEGFDLAIHNGPLADSALVARAIGSSPIVTVASPAYLAAHGEPADPAALAGHECVVFAPRGEARPWRFGDGTLHQPKGRFRTGDAEQIRAAVLADIGLAHTPAWLFAPEIAAGTVRPVLAGNAPAPITISAVHPAARRVAPKMRVFVERLEMRLRG